MSTNRAEYQGECQVCGRVQKLPDGNLAKHGYNVTWGRFQGTCPGSNHLPWEVNKDLVQGAVESAREQLTTQEALIARIESLVDGAEVYYSRSYGHDDPNLPLALYTARGLPRGGYTPERGHLTVIEQTYEFGGGGSYMIIHWVSDRDGHTEKLNQRTVAEATKTHNAFYVKSDLAPHAKFLSGYIDWQTKRLAAWAPKPLTPVEKEKPTGQFSRGQIVEYKGQHWTIVRVRGTSARIGRRGVQCSVSTADLRTPELSYSEKR